MPKLQRKRKAKSGLGPAAVAAVALVNQAETYGVTIAPADVAAGALYWQVISARHLPPEENKGRHNIYIDALDEAGQRYRESALRIG